jgi:hypothetical protein
MMTRKFTLRIIAGLLAVLFIGELQAQNELTQAEKEEGFVLLFDGKTSDGWRGYKKDVFPDRWLIEDGTIHFDPKAEGSRVYIIFDKMFS